MGVEIDDPADVSELRGAPESFKRFVARTVEQLQAEEKCPGAAVGVTVQTLRTDGFAIGGVNACGGYEALWAQVDGTWKEVYGTQDSLDCAVLRRYRVPSDVAGDTCYDYKGKKEHSYHQA
ncbi:hypothetical protein CLV35_2617 [Motilibacter peucedani]|uniref:Uncharacterized protein n=1 Tax=Motilibacter peucedani TaxID=598650 RepID=A0A420XPM4_9ACTN|nr:hypothetical protein CLV35_2617 [Motilibacter peucedani]